MLTSAVLVPGTVLLVPGAGGRQDAVMAGLREAAVRAVRSAVSTSTGRVVVVSPGSVERHLGTVWRADLGAAGIAGSQLGWPMPTSTSDRGRQVPILSGVASAAVALVAHAVGQDRASASEVVEVLGARTASDPGRADALRALGRELVGGSAGNQDAVVLVVAGCLSARNGLTSPLAPVARAADVDEAIEADLADGGPEARARLAGLPEQDAAELAISGWAPWQVLVGACGTVEGITAGPTLADRQLGVRYLVTTWSVPEVSA